MKIPGSCAIVTGGADGIGKGLVEFFVAEGGKVVFGDISVDKGSALERELNKNEQKVAFCKCDVRNESDLIALFEKAESLFGGAQIVVNNAGIAPFEEIASSTSEIGPVVDINLSAVLKGTSLAIQHFNKQKKNPKNKKNDFCVINISSFSAISPLSIAPIYSTTKRGVMYFTQIMGYLKNFNIRVNCVLPGFAKTQLTKLVTEDPRLSKVIESDGGYVTISDIVKSINLVITDEEIAGDAYLVLANQKTLLPRLDKPLM